MTATLHYWYSNTVLQHEIKTIDFCTWTQIFKKKIVIFSTMFKLMYLNLKYHLYKITILCNLKWLLVYFWWTLLSTQLWYGLPLQAHLKQHNSDEVHKSLWGESPNI